MNIFDPHIHMSARTTEDYERMYAAGVRALCEPSFWMGQPRTNVGAFEDYFLSLVGWERFRASQFGIHHFCALGLNPKEANNESLARQVLDLLPFYLEKDNVVAIGEIGYDEQTPQEDRVLCEQFELAKDLNLPILIHTPHRDKKRGTHRCLAVVKESGIDPQLVLIDHNTEETVASVKDHGCYAGHSLYPHTKMNEERMVKIVQQFGGERIIINSAADWGISDPMMLPKAINKMKKSQIPLEVIEQIVWKNPVSFFAQSGRMNFKDVERPIKIDQTQKFSNNTVLRGQAPQVEDTLI